MDNSGNPIPTEHLVWNDQKQMWLHPNGFAPNPYSQFGDLFSSKVEKQALASTSAIEHTKFSDSAMKAMHDYLVDGCKSYSTNEEARINAESVLELFSQYLDTAKKSGCKN